jgi:hypothetical protein
MESVPEEGARETKMGRNGGWICWQPSSSPYGDRELALALSYKREEEAALLLSGAMWGGEWSGVRELRVLGGFL